MHISVLLNEAIKGLEIAAGDIFVDATLGGGGHSSEVCRIHARSVRIVAIDRDSSAIDRARQKISESECDVVFVNDNFRNLAQILDDLSLPAADKFLFDLGFSSDQIAGSGRGFSFMQDEPLIMTYEVAPGKDALTADQLVNEWSESELEQLLRELGEERYASLISRAIVTARNEHPIRTTKELREIVERAVPLSYLKGRIHPATRTFQAIRIAVNGELTAIAEGLTAAWQRLNPGGRIAVISFHSLEDRMVKQFFKDKVRDGEGVTLAKKPVTASEEELEANPRARSAKLRIIEKSKSN